MGTHEFLILVSSILCLLSVSLGYEPVDNYLIDCGSVTNRSVGNRVFVSDSNVSNILSTSVKIFVSSRDSISPTFGSALYETARIFVETSYYNFSIKQKGWHWVRLHFFPFVDEKFNMSKAKFSVSVQNFTLLREFQAESSPTIKEYSFNIAYEKLILTITPSANSFAFLNALEVISLPNEFIPDGARTIDPPNRNQNLITRALQTVVRVNMGNKMIIPQNDTLWRLWVSDEAYLKNPNLVKFVSKIGAVNYSRGWPKAEIAPPSVYGTATTLHSQPDPNTLANVTWLFDVDPGLDYLLRFHFCDIVSSVPNQLFFNVFFNSWIVQSDFDLSNKTSDVLGAPYYMDVIARSVKSHRLSISVGPSNVYNAYPNAILNGLEIMKISNSRGGFDAMASEIESSSSSKVKVWVTVGTTVGASFVIVLLAFVVFLVCRSRRRENVMAHSPQEHININGEKSIEAIKSPKRNSVISKSIMGYCFPLVVVKEATYNFSESLVIGVGGFGKVYKGVLKDDTEVAVKRGVSQSKQGFEEFKTEIEMLSQFRHRHLVSFIGYCNEQNEMIIIYEYMENGTLRDHLYGLDLPKLNWRQRLEISIGSARGLHYLHTGTANAIIHRDVKSANILLDENLMAKVADFGISKVGPEIDKTHVSTAVKGSFGYLDPEYLTRQKLTEKSDVYSFGVVMLEILCGRPVIHPSLPREMVNLVDWVMEQQKQGELEKIVDLHIASEIKPESLRKFADTAEKCLADCGIDRPTMGEVLWNLESALQLQGYNNRLCPNIELNNHVEAYSTTQFSVGSLGGLDGLSMSRVFSQMAKAEMR